MSMHRTPRRGRVARWTGDLALGVRLGVAGGRSGWARLAMIAAGVGLGVMMLLLAAGVPAALGARDARVAAREPAWSPEEEPARGPDTLLIARADTEYRGVQIYGRVVRPEGPRAPLPPGVTRWPGPGELVVSPALARLLDSDEGALLRERWRARVVGTIGPEGLAGPGEYAYYLGSDRLTADTPVVRVRAFGGGGGDATLDPVLLVLGAVAVAALLVPVMIFVTTAVRFGGEARDRRLAALRLVGADAAMTRRIAAGETLAGALLGLVAGGLLYLALRQAAVAASVAGTLVDPADVRPVPALAVLVTVSALRRVTVEPLGVVRRGGGHRRRLWWRLTLPAAGLALLHPLYDGVSEEESGFEYLVVAGVAALLAGVALLLPWLVEATVRRLRGGNVAWELAVRRLQLDSGTAVRAVSGIAVSVAGAIALNGLFGGVQALAATEAGRDASGFQAVVLPYHRIGSDWAGKARRWEDALHSTPGVRAVGTVATVPVRPSGSGADDVTARLEVGGCAVLRQEARIGKCADGDVFVVNPPAAPTVRPGTTLVLGEPGTAGSARWTLPRSARTARPGGANPGNDYETVLLATPKAMRDVRLTPASVTHYVALDPADPDALDRLRNAVAALSPIALVRPVDTSAVFAGTLGAIRQGPAHRRGGAAADGRRKPARERRRAAAGTAAAARRTGRVRHPARRARRLGPLPGRRAGPARPRLRRAHRHRPRGAPAARRAGPGPARLARHRHHLRRRRPGHPAHHRGEPAPAVAPDETGRPAQRVGILNASA